MNEDRIINLVGMAQKAGKIKSGDFIVEKILQQTNPNIPLLLLASNCSKNNREKYEILAQRKKVVYRLVLTKEKLGQAIGKSVRAVVVINDIGFAKAILKEIDIVD